jgi:hypothetical protein
MRVSLPVQVFTMVRSAACRIFHFGSGAGVGAAIAERENNPHTTALLNNISNVCSLSHGFFTPRRSPTMSVSPNSFLRIPTN